MLMRVTFGVNTAKWALGPEVPQQFASSSDPLEIDHAGTACQACVHRFDDNFPNDYSLSIIRLALVTVGEAGVYEVLARVYQLMPVSTQDGFLRSALQR